MLTGLIGTACFEHPTLVLTSSYSPAELISANKKYEDYISSFDKASNDKAKPATRRSSGNQEDLESDAEDDDEYTPEVMGRLDSYSEKAEMLTGKMLDIIRSIETFQPMEQNISEMKRESISQQALAINNKATSLNRKAIGLFHPLQAREAHAELVEASEALRGAAHTLYASCLQEDPGEQTQKFSQARKMMLNAKGHIDQFNKLIQSLK
jgi:hypothetical protein